MTPTQASPHVPIARHDTVALDKLLGNMKGTLKTLNQTFSTLNSQSAQMSTLGPSMDDCAREITILRRDIHKEGQKQDTRMNDVKEMINNALKVQVVGFLKLVPSPHSHLSKTLTGDPRPTILGAIKNEVEKQVKIQVDAQIDRFLPIPLQQQKEECTAQLEKVEISLANSEARRENSGIRPANEDEPLKPVLKLDGTTSPLFPNDLMSLMSYDAAKARDLVKDYNLTESDVREDNLSRFLSHIGIQFRLVAHEMADIEATLLSDTNAG